MSWSLASQYLSQSWGALRAMQVFKCSASMMTSWLQRQQKGLLQMPMRWRCFLRQSCPVNILNSATAFLLGQSEMDCYCNCRFLKFWNFVCCLVWAVDLGVQIADVGRSLYIVSFCPAMTSLNRYLEEASFSISIEMPRKSAVDTYLKDYKSRTPEPS